MVAWSLQAWTILKDSRWKPVSFHLVSFSKVPNLFNRSSFQTHPKNSRSLKLKPEFQYAGPCSSHWSPVCSDSLTSFEQTMMDESERGLSLSLEESEKGEASALQIESCICHFRRVRLLKLQSLPPDFCLLRQLIKILVHLVDERVWSKQRLESKAWIEKPDWDTKLSQIGKPHWEVENRN